MSFPTFADMQAEVEADSDLESEDFISTGEMINTFNEAVRVCEANIHKLGLEDIYFKKRDFLALVSGDNEVDLPDDIYARKIIRLVYATTDRVYPITRARKNVHYEEMEETRVMNVGTENPVYQYELLNQGAGENKIYLIPAAQETSSANVVIFYIREAQRMDTDAETICDIPEFENFIKKYVKWKWHFKEGHPSTPDLKIEMEAEKQLMIETLTNMVPDGDSTLEKDLSPYEEMN